MKQDYKVWLLIRLLEKYEKSKGFFENKTSTRKVALSFTVKNIRAYHYGEYQEKEAIEEAVKELVQSQIVTIQWVKGEQGNLIKGIALNVNQLKAAYHIAQMCPKERLMQSFFKQVSEMDDAFTILGLRKAAEGWKSKALAKKKIDVVWPKEETVRNDCFAALRQIAMLEDDIDERMFSVQCYGNSKKFSNNVKAGVVRVLRLSDHYQPEPEETEAETLEKFRVLGGGSDFRLAGRIVIQLGGGFLDISAATGGIALAPDDLKMAGIARMQAKIMVSVENLAVFRELLRRSVLEEVVLVYSGGFYSQSKLAFLRTIMQHMKQEQPEALFYHWGDIDLGGIRIFNHIRKNAIPELKPLYMSAEVLAAYDKYCYGFDETYQQKLLQVKDHEILQLRCLVETMIAQNKRMEQESILCAEKKNVNLLAQERLGM